MLRLDEILDMCSRQDVDQTVVQLQRLEDLAEGEVQPTPVEPVVKPANHGAEALPAQDAYTSASTAQDPQAQGAPTPTSPPPPRSRTRRNAKPEKRKDSHVLPIRPLPPPPPVAPPSHSAGHLVSLSALLDLSPDQVLRATELQRREHSRRQRPRARPIWEDMRRLLSGPGRYGCTHPALRSERFACYRVQQGSSDGKAVGQKSEWAKTVELLRKEVRLKKKIELVAAELGSGSSRVEKREKLREGEEYAAELRAVQDELDNNDSKDSGLVLRDRTLGGRRVRCMQVREEVVDVPG